MKFPFKRQNRKNKNMPVLDVIPIEHKLISRSQILKFYCKINEFNQF